VTSDVKQIRRLATAGTITEEAGVTVIDLTKLEDGGDFSLHPITVDGQTLLLPHPSEAAYGVGLRGDADSIGRLGRALLSMERKLTGDTDEEPGE
jgi:hypothetical protein